MYGAIVVGVRCAGSPTAMLQPPTVEQQLLFANLRHNQDATDRFIGTLAGSVRLGPARSGSKRSSRHRTSATSAAPPNRSRPPG